MTRLQTPDRSSWRGIEAVLILLVFLIAASGLLLVRVGLNVRQEAPPLAGLGPVLLPAAALGLGLAGVHWVLARRGLVLEQLLLPVVGLLLAVGAAMIYRVADLSGVWQQFLRGLAPGLALMALFALYPQLVERVRRLAVPLSLIGLALPFLTAIFGVTDETGARLALKLGPLPAIQVTEILKLFLIIFLAWFIDREGRAAEGRARPVFGWLRLPPLWYFLPGVLFVALMILALVAMSDFGAVLVLAFLFVAMLYAGFDTRIFATIATIGLVLAVIAGLVLALVWEVPTVIQYRFLAYQNPWSDAELLRDGAPTGITVAEGPGYQIQQALYAVMAGGVSGTGLGFGSPEYIPLAQSDFIFAAILEEMGAVVGIALLFLFAVLILRIFRLAVLIPSGQIFERMLLVGIGVHFFIQVFIMVGGTLNLLPLTGITVPFLSLGGTALLVNLLEIGIALAILTRLERIL